MSFSDLFTSELLVRMLVLFALNPEQSFYQAEIKERTAGNLRNLQKMLHKLEEADLIRKAPRGRMMFYRFNTDHPAASDLTHLLIKTVAFGDVLKAGLEKSPLGIEFAFFYGSYAKGTPHADSDIDLFIASNEPLLNLSNIITPIVSLAGREINITSMPVSEFQKRHKEKNRFTLELLSCQKIWLIGSDDEFKALVD